MKVPLCNKKKEAVAYTRIDRDDFKHVKDLSWHITNSGYAASTIYTGGGRKYPKYRTILMHRWILGLPKDTPMVDHINRDKLDNRRNNLREASASLNAYNRDIQKNNKTGVRGVTFRSRIINGRKYEYWVVSFGRKHCGQFNNKKEAVRARLLLEKNYGTI